MTSPETPSASADAQQHDLYAILSVPREASAADLKAAFRRLSQRYHPDKHVEESAKLAATDQFTKVKEAYEILSNDKLRRIYNDFGLDAAREAASPTMELMPYSDLVARFRDNNAQGGPSGPNAPRDAYFTVINSFEPRVDATGLVVALEDGDDLRSATLAAVSQVSVSAMATAYLSQNTTVAARYALAGHSSHLRHARPAGPGELALSARRQLDPHMHAEATAHLALDGATPPTLGLKAFRALSSRSSAALETTYCPSRGDLTTAITCARSFDERCTANASWAFGAAQGFAFTWRRSAYDEYVSDVAPTPPKETEPMAEEPPRRLARLADALHCLVAPMGWRWTARLSAMDASIALVLRRPIGRHAPLWAPCEPTGPGGGSVKVRAQVGAMGWELEVGGGRKYVIADTAWGTSVALGNLGVVWRLKMSRGGHRFSLPVVLVSSVADARTATVAAAATSLAVAVVQVAVVAPWRVREARRAAAEAKARRADVLSQAREDAEAARALLVRAVARSRAHEEAAVFGTRERAGLLIVRAVYGEREAARKLRFGDASVRGREVEVELTEVADCVQALVEKSALQIICATKSTLSGFWDPSAFGEKEGVVLRIWYLFRGQMHECTLADDEPIELPLATHRVERWS